jgi:hypothetical protein
VVYSSGLINGQVALKGPLSIDKVTFGVGLRIGHGSWHWLNEVTTGDIGVFHPGEQHDSMYMPGSLYATATLSLDRLEEKAAQVDLVLDRRTLGGTGFHKQHLPDGVIRRLRRRFEMIHAGTTRQAAAQIRNGMVRERETIWIKWKLAGVGIAPPANPILGTGFALPIRPALTAIIALLHLFVVNTSCINRPTIMTMREKSTCSEFSMHLKIGRWVGSKPWSMRMLRRQPA